MGSDLLNSYLFGAKSENGKGKKTRKLISFLIPTLLFITGMSAQAASFDCAKASTSVEKTICADSQLSELDSQLMQAYKNSLSSTADANLLKSQQINWLLNTRNKCTEPTCIQQVYKERIAVLNGSHGKNVSVELNADIKPLESNVPSTPAPSSQDGNTQPANLEQPTANNSIENPAQPVVADVTTQRQAVSNPATSSQITPPSNSSSNKPDAESSPDASKDSDLSDEPPSMVANVLNALKGLVVLLIVIGLIRPAWILRWDQTPNRIKVVGYLFPIGLLLGGVGQFMRSDTGKASVEDIGKEQAVSESNEGGEELYKYFKSVRGNADRPGYFEEEFVKGRLVSTCNINGKPRGKYGWIETKQVFIDGYRIKDPEVNRMLVFAISDEKGTSVVWRGEQYKDDLIGYMKQTCD